MVFIFFFKQKTAYDMRISDWSSDVCSSDLYAKGMGDRWTLELLLTAGPWINGDRRPEDKYLSTMLNAAEMLLKGCTACYDLFSEKIGRASCRERVCQYV